MEKICSHCGSSKLVILYKKEKYLCNKHRLQLSRHGDFIRYARSDKNEIVVKGEYGVLYIYNCKSKVIAESKIDISDIPKIQNYRWHMYGKYVGGRIDGHKLVFLHHVILGRKEDFFVDHINGNRLDNRRENLRFVTAQQNVWNQSRDRGVSFDKVNNKYCAYIEHNGKKIWLGRHKSYKEALKVRKQKEKELFVI